MTSRITIKITANFKHNLNSIEQFLIDLEMPHVFNLLLVEISEKVIPNLEQFPGMGRNFMRTPINSVEVGNEDQKLQNKIKGGELREYLISNYLILYARFDETIELLSIRHHRQLSFDFNSRWV